MYSLKSQRVPVRDMIDLIKILFLQVSTVAFKILDKLFATHDMFYEVIYLSQIIRNSCTQIYIYQKYT